MADKVYTMKPYVFDEKVDDLELAEEIRTKMEKTTVWDEGMAGWAIRKINEINMDHDRLIAEGREEIFQLQKQIEKAEEKIAGYEDRKEKRTSWFRQNLRMFLMNHPKTKRLKTKEELELFQGFLRVKKPAPKVTQPKELQPVLIQYLKEFREKFLKVTTKVEEKADWKELKKVVEIRENEGVYEVYDPETERVIPGFAVEKQEPSFEIEFTL